MATRTLAHYEQNAEAFWEGTRDHDVSENYAALLDALGVEQGLRILDFGCGPGRDLSAFREMGHAPVGLDGCAAFVQRARAQTGCEVIHQDFFELDLGDRQFDGIFANASLFHVARQHSRECSSSSHPCSCPTACCSAPTRAHFTATKRAGTPSAMAAMRVGKSIACPGEAGEVTTRQS